MHARAKTAIAALGISALAVVGLDTYTYAGTGDSLILGKLNKSSKTTHVTSTGKGPALSLHAKGNRPALAVDSNAKIVRLNADRVDGKDAAALQHNVRVFTARSGSSDEYGSISFLLPELPDGQYQASYSVYMDGAAGSTEVPVIASCAFDRVDWNAKAAHTTTTAIYWSAALSGSDVIRERSKRWLLYCAAYHHGGPAAEWSIDPSEPVRITLTRIDRTIGSTLAASRTNRSLATPAPLGR